MGVQAVKLAQAGFGDFLADNRVSRLKGKCDDNKEVYFVDTICNIAGHKQIDCEYWSIKNWSNCENKTKEA